MIYKIGDVVKHTYAAEDEGTIVDIRTEPFEMYFVNWNSHPENNDWFEADRLHAYRVSAEQNPIAPPIGADGAIGISKSDDRLHSTPAIEKDTQYPFGN